jgi:hemerythrin superfamily protein
MELPPFELVLNSFYKLLLDYNGKEEKEQYS